jgi:hypothetical protein
MWKLGTAPCYGADITPPFSKRHRPIVDYVQVIAGWWRARRVPRMEITDES